MEVNFLSLYFQALKKCGLGLLLIYLLFTFFDQSLTVLMEANLRSPNGATGGVFFLGALYLTNSIFFTTLATITCIFGITKLSNSWWQFIERYLNQSCIEVVRAWGKVLGWSLFLIIPGFIKYLQYLLVPFVVIIDPKYQSGEKDALTASATIFKKHWLSLLLAVLGFQVVWSYISVDLFDAYRMILTTPVQAIFVSALEAMIFLLYILVIFKRIQKSQIEVTNEPAL